MNRLEKILVIFFSLVFFASVVTAGYFYKQYSEIKQNPAKFSQEDANQLIREVSKIIVLPEGEVPTIATVSEPDKLKTQAFFANAALGDKVLIYASSRKALLYRPSEKKIIEVAAPISIGEQQTKTPANSANRQEPLEPSAASSTTTSTVKN